MFLLSKNVAEGRKQRWKGVVEREGKELQLFRPLTFDNVLGCVPNRVIALVPVTLLTDDNLR